MADRVPPWTGHPPLLVIKVGQKYIGLKNSRGAGDIFGFPICCSTSLPRANPIFEQLAQSGAAATGDGRGSSGEQTSILAALCVEQDLQGCVGGHRRCRVLGAKRKSCARPEHYRF